VEDTVKTDNFLNTNASSKPRGNPLDFDKMAAAWAEECQAKGLTTQAQVEMLIGLSIQHKSADFGRYVAAVMGRLKTTEATRPGAVMEECNVGAASR
jgi:hypothetical protein